MRRALFYTSVVLLFLGIFSCKKRHEYTLVTSTDSTATQKIFASDESEVTAEFNRALNEIIAAVSISKRTSGDTFSKGSLSTTVAGALIDTSKLNQGTVIINYFGKTLDNKKARTGRILITLPKVSNVIVPWKTKGLKLTIDFDQYEVIILSNNNSLWLDGPCYFTNVTGGLLKYIANPNVVPGDSLNDKVEADFDYTYNDNVSVVQTWPWHIKFKRSLYQNDTVVEAKLTGDTILNNTANVSTWGTNRSGQGFYTCITAPLWYNTYGQNFFYKPLQGRKVVLGIASPITATYGVDASGSQVSNGNPFGYIISWTNSSQQAQSLVIPY